ncbi:hypothetical protein THAOC_19478 [Thalassiosira oceanica]|uniref:GrpE protein homolog n=1 Tax=Thalassiosira oceanica TaxID=159749 RepID=K0S2G0_THAOC|nr:hypothetical protein THAOC_19478 [Thalassiosira oceanica]|eukprot:EJK60223.1 hypothetical protein THAOC_19478 [Thalassiosira oceanica]
MSFRTLATRVARRARTANLRHRSVTSIAPPTMLLSPSNYDQLRLFSSKPEESATTEEDTKTDSEAAEETAQGDDASNEQSGENLGELETEIKDLKDNLLRSLAEAENTRRIAKRDVDQARSFAISSFAKSLLDTSDNLTRALDAVPEELRHDHEGNPVLANLYEGISMTDDGLTKAFAKNGLKKFGAPGEKFDPNLHEALFEYPDPAGEPGNIGQVMKVGFMLNKRVIRPAEVGVVKSA